MSRISTSGRTTRAEDAGAEDTERPALTHAVEQLLQEQCETNRLLRELIAESRAKRRVPAKRQATVAKNAPGKVRVADPVLRRQMRQQLKQRFGQ